MQIINVQHDARCLLSLSEYSKHLLSFERLLCFYEAFSIVFLANAREYTANAMTLHKYMQTRAPTFEIKHRKIERFPKASKGALGIRSIVESLRRFSMEYDDVFMLWLDIFFCCYYYILRGFSFRALYFFTRPHSLTHLIHCDFFCDCDWFKNSFVFRVDNVMENNNNKKISSSISQTGIGFVCYEPTACYIRLKNNKDDDKNRAKKEYVRSLYRMDFEE